MSMVEKFLNDAKIGAVVEIIIGSKTISGSIVTLDSNTVQIKKQDGNISTISLDSICFFEFSNVEPTSIVPPSNVQVTNTKHDHNLVLKEHGITYFENIEPPKIKNYQSIAKETKDSELLAISDSLDYAIKQNHEFSPADYKIQENIKRLNRIINSDKLNKEAANMLGSLYYQCKSDRLSLDIYKSGNDFESAFMVAKNINSDEMMEYFACHHLIYNIKHNPYILKWLLNRMYVSNDYSVINRIHIIDTFQIPTFIIFIKSCLLLNDIQYDKKLDNDESKSTLDFLIEYFLKIKTEFSQKMKNHFITKSIINKKKEDVVPPNGYYFAAKKAREEDKDLIKAEELYLKAIKHNDRASAASADLVSLMIQRRNFQKAAQYLGQYGSKYMREEAYKNVKNQLSSNNSDLTNEISKFENVKKEPNFFILAQKAEHENKNLQEAISYYQQAIKQGQRLTASVPNLVSIYTRLEMYNEALNLLDNEGKSCMETSKYLNLRIGFFSAAKNKKYKNEINDTYNQIKLLTYSNEKQTDLMFSHASLMNQIEEYDDAIILYKHCLKKINKGVYKDKDKKDKQILNILLGLCNSSFKLKKYNEAIQYASDIIKIKPDNDFAQSIKNLINTENPSLVEKNINFIEDVFIDDVIGNNNISSYFLDRIDKINLENELKCKGTLKDGIFTKQPEDAEKIIQLTISAQSKFANDEMISNSFFAIAKLIRQLLDRNKSINQTKILCEQNYQIQVAKGCYFFGNYRINRSQYGRNFDTSRYCFLESISIFKDTERPHKCWDVSTIRYIQTYFYSLTDIKEDTKLYYFYKESDYTAKISESMQRSICVLIPEFVVGMIELIAVNSRIKTLILDRILKNPMVGKILDFIGKIEKSNILDSIELNEFTTIWDAITKRYFVLKRNFATLIEKVIESSFMIGQLQDNFGKFSEHDFHKFLTSTDKEYIEDLRIIFTLLQRFNEESEFDYKAQTLGNIEEKRQRLEEKIIENPTNFSYEKILPCLRQLQGRIYTESSEFYGNSVPSVKVELAADCSIDKDQKIIRAPISFTNSNNVQNADNVSIQIKGETKNIQLINDAVLSRRLLVGNGIPEEEIFEFRVTDEIINSKAFTVKITITYQYKKSMTEIANATQQVSLPINLYSNLIFVPIENKFEPYRNGSEVREESMFYGRDNDIKNIIQQISDNSGNMLKGRCLALYGQTRTGKSSLLYHLEKKLREINPEENVIINIGSIGEQNLSGSDITDFLYTLLDELKSEINNKHPQLNDILLSNQIIIDPDKILDNPEHSQLYFNKIFKDINRCLENESRNYNFVVMIDEFTYIYDWICRGSMTDRIMKFWKAFIQNNAIFAIIIGQDHMMKFIDDKQFTNDFGSTDLRKVSYLQKEDAKRLMYEPIMITTDTGEKINRFQEAALNRLYELTAGSAFLIMNLCAGLVDYLNKTKTMYITKAHVDEYLKQNINTFEESRFFEPQYADKSIINTDEIDKRNKAILHKIAQHSNRKEWTPLNSIISCEEDRQTLKTLEQRDVIEISKNDRCKIKIKLYKEWIIAKYGLEATNE